VKIADLLVQIAILVVVTVAAAIIINSLPYQIAQPEIVVPPPTVIMVPSSDLDNQYLQHIHNELLTQTKLIKQIKNRLFKTCW
jgi:hypothetical protein